MAISPFVERMLALDQTLLADNLEMKLVAQALRQLTHKLPLRSAISFSERMDTIGLGKQSGEFAGEVPTRQSLEKMFLRQFAKYSAQLRFDQLGRRELGDSSPST